ncbi:MAG: S9 family peptidase [Trueperaceae bacterium]|nr:S9 family peptidase [Trueperaceae bacterium]
MPSPSERLEAYHLRDLTFLSDPQLAPDGASVFLVRTRIHDAPDGTPGYRSEVVEVDVAGPDAQEDGDAPARLVAGGAASDDGRSDARRPRPSPDGRWLAFLADVPDPAADDASRRTTQVRILDRERGGAPVTRTAFAGGASDVAWHPSGATFVALGRDVAPEGGEGDVVARTVERLHAKEDGRPAPGVRPEGRTGLAWGRPDRTDVHPLDGPADGVSDARFAPDGGTLWVFGPADVAEGDAFRTSLWRLDVGADGVPHGAPARVAAGLLQARALSVGPNDALAWLAPSDPDDLAAPVGLWTWSPAHDGPTLVTDPDVDAAPSVGGDARYGAYEARPVFTPGGIVVIHNRAGSAVPARVGPDGDVEDLQPPGRVTTAFAHASGTTLALQETPARPGHLVRLDPDRSATVRYDPNAAFVARFDLRDADGPLEAPSGGGPVPWWRLRPHRRRRDGAIVLQVHGGPHTNAGFGFAFEHHLLTARGYAVAFANPRGSSSYGEAWATAMIGGYGTVDADDVLAVADAAQATSPVDAPPVHLTGGSYGGFMTNWLVGRTDRFASAVTQRSIAHWASFYGTSDIGYRFAEQEVRGTPWNDPEVLWRQSPLRWVANVTTPILILHADADHRCPVEQAEQWFVALKRIGKADVKFVRFPEEGHELSRSGRPDRRVRRLEEIVAWFETHP